MSPSARRSDDFDTWLDELARRTTRLRRTTPPPDAYAAARQVNRDADLIGRFVAAAAEVGVRVTLAELHDWSDVVADRVRQLGARRVGLCFRPNVWPDGAIEALQQRLARVVEALLPDPPAEAWAGLDLAITDVAAAVAETGSLVWDSGPGRPRVATLLPRMHLAVVRAGRIVPDLLDLWTDDANSLPAQRVLITGPSKTADIEGVLVTGVHGPGVVEAVVVRD